MLFVYSSFYLSKYTDTYQSNIRQKLIIFLVKLFEDNSNKTMQMFVLNICSVTVMLPGLTILYFLAFLDKLFLVLYSVSFQLPFRFQGTDAYLKGYLLQWVQYVYVSINIGCYFY